MNLRQLDPKTALQSITIYRSPSLTKRYCEVRDKWGRWWWHTEGASEELWRSTTYAITKGKTE